MTDAPLWSGQSRAHLVDMPGGHALQRDAASAFVAMQSAAMQQGIDLQIASSFRDFDRQLAIWNSKWAGTRPLLSLQGEPLAANSLSDEEKLHAILTWSALPGASRHHWGTDLDVFDKQAVDESGQPLQLVCAEYEPGGPCYRLACWLDSHAAEFGFYRPYAQYQGGVAPEPWHLSYQPVAREIIHQLDITVLERLLADAEMAGKHIVLAQLDSLFKRYTLNGEAL